MVPLKNQIIIAIYNGLKFVLRDTPMNTRNLPAKTGIAFLLVLFVLTCGCGDYVPNHDVIVIGLNTDGTQAWTRTLDNGFDDVAGDIAELPDGTLVIAAGSGSKRYESPVPSLVLLAPDGTLIAERPCPSVNGEFRSVLVTGTENITTTTYYGNVAWFDSSGNLVRITETGLNDLWAQAPSTDGGIVVAGMSMEQFTAGSVPVFNESGAVTTRGPLANESVETPGCRETILEAGDRKIPVTECVAPVASANQAALAAIDRNGTVQWKRGYGAYGLANFWSVAPAADGSGYFLSAYGDGSRSPPHRYAARVGNDGSVVWVTDLGPAPLFYPMPWDIRDGQVRAIVPSEFMDARGSYIVQPQLATFGPGGEVTGLHNISASRIIVPVSGSGYFSAGIRDGPDHFTDMSYARNTAKELHARRFGPDGSLALDQVVGDGTIDQVVRVLQKADGGYVILAQRENG